MIPRQRINGYPCRCEAVEFFIGSQDEPFNKEHLKGGHKIFINFEINSCKYPAIYLTTGNKEPSSDLISRKVQSCSQQKGLITGFKEKGCFKLKGTCQPVEITNKPAGILQ